MGSANSNLKQQKINKKISPEKYRKSTFSVIDTHSKYYGNHMLTSNEIEIEFKSPKKPLPNITAMHKNIVQNDYKSLRMQFNYKSMSITKLQSLLQSLCSSIYLSSNIHSKPSNIENDFHLHNLIKNKNNNYNNYNTKSAVIATQDLNKIAIYDRCLSTFNILNRSIIYKYDNNKNASNIETDVCWCAHIQRLLLALNIYRLNENQVYFLFYQFVTSEILTQTKNQFGNVFRSINYSQSQMYDDFIHCKEMHYHTDANFFKFFHENTGGICHYTSCSTYFDAMRNRPQDANEESCPEFYQQSIIATTAMLSLQSMSNIMGTHNYLDMIHNKIMHNEERFDRKHIRNYRNTRLERNVEDVIDNEPNVLVKDYSQARYQQNEWSEIPQLTQAAYCKWKNRGPFVWQTNHQQLMEEITSVHINLKEEILNNALATIEPKQWNITLQKCLVILQSWTGKKIRSSQKFVDAEKEYSWKRNENINAVELLSFKFYTDFDNLQFELTKTLRMTSDFYESEDDIPIKQRLGEFYHWRKILDLSVRKFGYLLGNRPKETLFHGVNPCMPIKIHGGDTIFYGPFSASKSIDVARSFATKDGMILELQTHYPMAKTCYACDVSSISDYPEEQEVLVGLLHIKILKINLGFSSDQEFVLAMKGEIISQNNHFFVADLFNKQIFSMSEKLEKILIPVLNMNKNVDKIVNRRNRGRSRAKSYEHKITSKSRERFIFDDISLDKNLQHLIYIEIFRNNAETKTVKFETISNGLRKYFFETESKNEEKNEIFDGQISFKKICTIFPNVTEIYFLNNFSFDEFLLQSFVKFMKKKSTNLEMICFEYFDGSFFDRDYYDLNKEKMKYIVSGVNWDFKIYFIANISTSIGPLVKIQFFKIGFNDECNHNIKNSRRDSLISNDSNMISFSISDIFDIIDNMESNSSNIHAEDEKEVSNPKFKPQCIHDDFKENVFNFFTNFDQKESFLIYHILDGDTYSANDNIIDDDQTFDSEQQNSGVRIARNTDLCIRPCIIFDFRNLEYALNIKSFTIEYDIKKRNTTLFSFSFDGRMKGNWKILHFVQERHPRVFFRNINSGKKSCQTFTIHEEIRKNSDFNQFRILLQNYPPELSDHENANQLRIMSFRMIAIKKTMEVKNCNSLANNIVSHLVFDPVPQWAIFSNCRATINDSTFDQWLFRVYGGIIYWLACDYGQKPKNILQTQNQLCQVKCSSLDCGSNANAIVCSTRNNRCITEDKEDSWIEIDFSKSGVVVNPTHYALRHYCSWNEYALRNWRFEAYDINMGGWIVLKEHENDQHLNKSGSVHLWNIDDVQISNKYFNKFRIFQTDFNSYGDYRLALGAFEIYGRVIAEIVEQNETELKVESEEFLKNEETNLIIHRLGDVFLQMRSKMNIIDINLTQVINDYCFLMKHLKRENVENEIHDEALVGFEYIFDQINEKYFNSEGCNLIKCRSIRRNTGNRMKEHYIQDNIHSLDELCSMRILDAIHCAIMHAFDTGYKLTKNERLEIYGKKSGINGDDDLVNNKGGCQLFKDVEMKKMKDILQKKQESYSNIREDIKSNDISTNSKFVSIVNENHGSFDKEYSFGYEYIYDESEIERPFFIPQIYENIKEEILSGEFYFSIKDFDCTYASVLKRMATIYIKEMMLRIQHLLSLLLYCNFNDISAYFSSTYRRIPFNESDESMIDRHSEFREWGRLLKEAVEEYGTKLSDSEIDIFFHGINIPMVFPSFYARFYGPTSTTASYILCLLRSCVHIIL